MYLHVDPHGAGERFQLCCQQSGSMELTATATATATTAGWEICSITGSTSLQGHKKTTTISALVVLLVLSGLTLPVLIWPKRCPQLTQQ